MVLIRSEEAKNVKVSKELCGISTDIDYFKPCIRTSQILKSNEFLDKIGTVLSEDYINPFDGKISQLN